MSNNDPDWLEHLAIVDGLTEAEQDAWLRLRLAELELVAAKRYVMEITNREGHKRQAQSRLHVVRSSEAPGGDCVA